MHKAVLRPLRSEIWEGPQTNVPHHRYLAVLLFVNIRLLVLLTVATPVRIMIPIPAVPVVATPIPMVIPTVIPMVILTLATQVGITTVAIKDARVVALILEIQDQIHAI